MSCKDYKVLLVDRKFIEKFIEENHYSGSIAGCNSTYHFALFDGLKHIGSAFFGQPAMAGQYKRFSDNSDDVIELRRLCCIDDTPKNTESYFIGNMLRWLNKNTDIKIVISYADEQYGHSGVIYKASNFEYFGFKSGADVIEHNGKLYHDRALRNRKDNGELKNFAVRLNNAVKSGEAKFIKTKGKHTYVYKFKNPRKSNKPKELF